MSAVLDNVGNDPGGALAEDLIIGREPFAILGNQAALLPSFLISTLSDCGISFRISSNVTLPYFVFSSDRLSCTAFEVDSGAWYTLVFRSSSPSSLNTERLCGFVLGVEFVLEDLRSLSRNRSEVMCVLKLGLSILPCMCSKVDEELMSFDVWVASSIEMA